MEINELTTEEVKKVIYENCSNVTISEEDFRKNGLKFEKLLSDDLSLDDFHHAAILYFFCKNGILTAYLDNLSYEGYHFTSKVRFKLQKISADDLEVIAKQYFEAKHKMNVLEKVLESDKLRGLFAKMKASK